MDPCELQHQHETIIPLIKICRKIETCDSSQLSQWLRNFPQFFSENKSFKLLIKILLKGLCYHHASIPNNVFDAILLGSPNENTLINLDDSITKSAFNEEEEDEEEENQKEKEKEEKENKKQEAITLLQLPKVLQIVSFNFLTCKDLYEIQKTCRSLNIVSRDPNALYFHRIWKSNIHYSHPFYSRIKHLSLFNFSFGWNLKWGQSVQELNASSCYSNNDAYLQLYFQNIKKCNLSWQSVQLLRNNNIKHCSIQNLSISNCNLDGQSWKSLIQCISLKKLILMDIKCDMDLEFLRMESNPLQQLNYLKTDSSSVNQAQIFFHWILSGNGCNSKTFELVNVNNQECVLFPIYNSLSLGGIQNIAQLKLSTYYISRIESLLDNIVKNISFTNKKLDYFELEITEPKQLNSNISSIASMLGCCSFSKLTVSFETYDFDTQQANKWFLEILNLETNAFDAIEMAFVRYTDMYLMDEPNSIRYLDDLINNESNANILNNIAEKFAMYTVNDYDSWCKPLLNSTIKTKIQYEHGYDWNTVLEVYDDLDEQNVRKKWQHAQEIWNESVEPTIDKLVTERIDIETGLTLYTNAIDIYWNSFM